MFRQELVLLFNCKGSKFPFRGNYPQVGLYAAFCPTGGYLEGSRTRMGNHLSRRAVSGPLVQSTRNLASCEEETSSLLSGLATGLCSCLTLLPMGVARPPHYCGRRWSLTPPFHPYLLRGGLFLWPDPAGFPAPDVIRHRALWSADVPRRRCRRRDSPTNLGVR